jgi:C-terminal processing protease CtpA/Prc
VLPNEIYATEDGESFDVTGVPPDVPAPGLSRKNFENESDPGLEKAQEILGCAAKH